MHIPKYIPAKELDTPKAIVEAAIEQGTVYIMYLKTSIINSCNLYN